MTKDKIELLIIVQIGVVNNRDFQKRCKSTTSNCQNMTVDEEKCIFLRKQGINERLTYNFV